MSISKQIVATVQFTRIQIERLAGDITRVTYFNDNAPEMFVCREEYPVYEGQILTLPDMVATRQLLFTTN